MAEGVYANPMTITADGRPVAERYCGPRVTAFAYVGPVVEFRSRRPVAEEVYTEPAAKATDDMAHTVLGFKVQLHIYKRGHKWR